MTSTMEEHITRADLEPVLIEHPGNRAFAESLSRIQNGRELVRLLGRYIHFNAPFGGGVANLAGEIAVRRDLFRDRHEASELLADRSSDVAAAVFFAAVDEFGDRSTRHHSTHRTLAHATLIAVAEFFDCDSELDAIVGIDQATLIAIRRVQEGYLLNRASEEGDLFRALGFHASSEILADEEFRILDGWLRAEQPELVEHLRSKEVKIDAVNHPAYTWIYIHTSVEADHFEYAVKGANLALHHYAGKRGGDQIKAEVLEGFHNFSRLQTDFMRNIME